MTHPVLAELRGDSILDEAYRAVHGPRQHDYGHPLDNWTLTANLITDTLRHKLRDGEAITAEEAVLCMVQVKVAREINRSKRDNRTDIGGYAEVLDMIVTERARRAEVPDGLASGAGDSVERS